MTNRQAATAARKDQIIRAAIALLAERGYQATTFEAICDKAGLSSKRLITYHFSSKGELFATVADQVVADAEAHMQPTLDAATGARELLAALIQTNVAFIASHLEQMRALQQIVLNGDHAWDRHHLESLNRLAGLFDNGQRTGAFRPCNSQIMAAALRASLDSTYGLLSAGVDAELCAKEQVELFDRATQPA
ncbi:MULTISPECIES: TetR/AcrR family transcriptional regulator [unclassified Streptomyces]|uniref:TetR/AcrR family transcriptional regulator n=1 Tax=unclassified Streptomyces TaxID=2593676 RepID=UPI0035E0A98E